MGRPRKDTEAVNVRLERPMLDRLDEWAASQATPQPTRPEAIRRLVQLVLGDEEKADVADE